MTPKQKAIVLVHKLETTIFANFTHTKKSFAKECALIAVDEILNLEHPYVIVYSETSENEIKDYTQEYYWELVKEEIQKL